jgi:hypothetical protein
MHARTAPLEPPTEPLDRPPKPPAPRAARSAGAKLVHARYLFTPILAAPVELESGKTYRIGRDRKNEIYFPSHHVSRVHALVRVEGDEATVSDEGSLNGTFVNGERVLEEQRLRDGDRITVSELDMAYIEATEEEARAILDGRWQSGLETARTAARCEELYGDLTDIAAAEIVQLLGNNRKTGCLEILPAGEDAPLRVFFMKGSVVHAESSALQGKDAACAAVRVLEGRFVFKPTKNTKLTMMAPVAKLLLEAMQPEPPAT